MQPTLQEHADHQRRSEELLAYNPAMEFLGLILGIVFAFLLSWA